MKNVKIITGTIVIFIALVANIALASKSISFATSLISPIKKAPLERVEKIECLDETIGDNSIKVALLLDTSNSMDGLIEQAKSQLWKIVGELARMTKDDSTPKLQIALYEYGNDGLAANTGYIRQINPFTSDMDLVSEKLFALSTNGGNEFCGHVIQTSLNELQWGKKNGDLKMIYIAGNESFAQGSVNYQTSIGQALEKGIVVNTIFCGGHEEGINLNWKNGAMIGKGEYMSINQNKATVYIQTPYDKSIGDLNLKLNKTYISYGSEGQQFKENQKIQDTNAGIYSSANVADRAVFKSSKSYSNASWDLVDAYKMDSTIVEKKKELPKELQNKSEEEVEQYIVAVKRERDEIQLKIRELDKQRREFITNEEAKNEKSVEGNLEKSMLESLRNQAKNKGYKIE